MRRSDVRPNGSKTVPRSTLPVANNRRAGRIQEPRTTLRGALALDPLNLAADQRLIRFGATVSDRPGGIAMLSAIIADLGVSIKDIYHERAWTGALDKVLVHCVVETTGSAHTATLFEVLEKDYEIHKDTVGGDGIYTVSNEIKK